MARFDTQRRMRPFRTSPLSSPGFQRPRRGWPVYVPSGMGPPTNPNVHIGLPTPSPRPKMPHPYIPSSYFKYARYREFMNRGDIKSLQEHGFEFKDSRQIEFYMANPDVLADLERKWNRMGHMPPMPPQFTQRGHGITGSPRASSPGPARTGPGHGITGSPWAISPGPVRLGVRSPLASQISSLWERSNQSDMPKSLRRLMITKDSGGGVQTQAPSQRDGKKPLIPMMARGGTVKKGKAAVVGENGPELIENKGDKITVTPFNQLLNPFAGYYQTSRPTPLAGNEPYEPGEFTPLLELPVAEELRDYNPQPSYDFSPVNYGNYGGQPTRPDFPEPSTPGHIRVRFTLPPKKRGTPEIDRAQQAWINSMIMDIRRQQKALEERKAYEAEAQGMLKEGVEGVKGGQARAAAGAQGTRETIRSGTAKGAQALSSAGEVAAGLPGRIGKAGKAATRQVQKQATSLTEGAQQQEVELGAEAEQRRNAGIKEGESLYDKGLSRMEDLRTEDMAAYRDTTAQQIEVQRQAIDAQYSQMEADLNAQYGDNPDALRAAKIQMNLDKSQSLGILSSQIGSHSNDVSANLRLSYASEISGKQTAMAQLRSQLRSAADALVSQTKVGLAGQTLAAGQAALGAVAGITAEQLKAQSWAEQVSANLQTQVASQISSLWERSNQFEITNDNAARQLDLTYEQLKLSGLDELADFTASMNTQYVPMAPYYASILNYYLQKEVRDELLAS